MKGAIVRFSKKEKVEKALMLSGKKILEKPIKIRREKE